MDCWWEISSLNMIFPWFCNGFYWLALIAWATPSDLLRVVQCKLQPSCCSSFSLIYMLHAVLCPSKLCTAFCILVCVTSDMFFCVHPCVIEWVCIRCLHEANTRVATVPYPGGLVSIPSPTFLITSFSYATHNLGLVDVQSNQNFKVEKVNWATSRWKAGQILLQKSKIAAIKSCT